MVRTDEVYHSDGASRRITRGPATVGVPSNPSCCGGEIEWTATDGCGSAQFRTTLVKPGIADSHVLARPTSPFSVKGMVIRLQGWGPVHTHRAQRWISKLVCLDNTPGDLYRLDGALVRNMDSTLRFESGHACSGCCGKGEVSLSFYNGCGSVITAGYTVRRSPLGPGVSGCNRQGLQGGAVLSIVFAPSGIFTGWLLGDLRCDGSFGKFSILCPGTAPHSRIVSP